MRLRLPAAHRRRLDDGTVPLINIGFLLLLYLLVAGEFGGVDELSPVLPSIDRTELRNEHLPVRVDVAAGDPVLVRINQQMVALDDIRTHLPVPDGRQPPILRADGNLTAAQLRAVLAALREAGYAELRLAARPPSSP